jgi:hypothetical protein
MVPSSVLPVPTRLKPAERPAARAPPAFATGVPLRGAALLTTTVTSSAPEASPSTARRKPRRVGTLGAVKEATGPSAPARVTAAVFEGRGDHAHWVGAVPSPFRERRPER